MKKSYKNILVAVVVVILVILIYKSPDEPYWRKENPINAIRVGRIYAYYLLNSYKQGLLRMSVNPAKAKIENSEFKEISRVEMDEQLEKKQIHISITAPIYTEQKDEEMILMAFERCASFVAMTFAYKGWLDEIVEIPEKGKMLFSVAVRYYIPADDRVAPKLVRKTANLPLLRNFTGRIGTTGRWVVFDYNYKYNLNDYFDWLLKEGESYSQQKLKESEEFADRQLEMDKESFEKFCEELMESADNSLALLYHFGSVAMTAQMKRIDGMYKIINEDEQGQMKENNE